MKQDWLLTKLSDVYDVRDGTHDSPKYQKEGFPLITSKNLKNGKLLFDNVNLISEDDYLKINQRSKVDQGDVLFAMIGTIGNPVVVDATPSFAIKNVALFKTNKLQNSNFLKYYLESEFVIQKMLADAKGTTQKFVGLGYLRSFPILLPSLQEQRRIVEILDQVFAAIVQAKENTEKNLKNVKELFDSYLHGVNAVKEPLGNLVNITTGKLDANAANENGKYPFFTCSREIFQINQYAFDCEAILLAGNNAVGDFNVKHTKVNLMLTRGHM